MSSAAYEALSRSDFEQSLIDAYPVVYRRLAIRFGDEQLAEEVSTDCLSQAFELWRTDPHYFSTHDLTAWSSRRAAWRAIDRLRERGRLVALPEERTLEDDEQPVSSALARRNNDSEATLSDRQAVWNAIQKLNPEDRDMLIRSYYDGMSDQEIGAVLYGLVGSAQARGLRVWRRRQKAQARLKDQLLEAGIDPADWGGERGQAL